MHSIELGDKGRCERECIEGPEPCIRLGFSTGHHAESLAGQWQVFTNHWRNVKKKTQGKTTVLLSQLKEFYTLPELRVLDFALHTKTLLVPC